MKLKFNLRKHVNPTTDIGIVCQSNGPGWVLMRLHEREREESIGVSHAFGWVTGGGATNPQKARERADLDANTFTSQDKSKDMRL